MKLDELRKAVDAGKTVWLNHDEIVALLDVAEAAQGVYSPNDRWGYLTDDEQLGAALKRLETAR